MSTSTSTSKSKKTPRDALRAKLLGAGHKAKTIMVTVFGEEVEVRQPTLEAILRTQSTSTDLKTRSVDMIIEYTFVPGTNEHVFETTDRDVILGWPFGTDIIALQDAIAELTGIDVDKAQEDLETNPLKEPS